MSGYVFFTDEQKRCANSVDLVDFITRQGEKLTRSGREWRWNRHDSVTVRDNQWFQHSAERGGLAIDFVQEFYHLPFPEAVTLLLGGLKGVEFQQVNQNAMLKQKPFVLPKANNDMRRVFAYLIKQRFLDREVVTYFAKDKMLYEDKEYHNAVFVGLDENGIPKHAHKKSTYSNGKNYRGNVEGSNPAYSFHHTGVGDALYVFEAPIDMLSFITLHKGNWQAHSYVALNGVSEHAMLYQLSTNEQIQKVVLSLDHDPAGIEATGRLTEILHEYGYDQVSCLQSDLKDWNENLKALNGIKSLPAREHPKQEACHDLCEELIEACECLKSNQNPHDDIMKHYENFIGFTPNGTVMCGKEFAAMEQLQSITGYALLAVQKQYHQFEHPVTIEQLTEQLYANYHPHQDRGKLRSKADDIQQDMVSINCHLNTAGICSLDDKKNLITSYMSLALNCVKAHVFITLENQQFQKQAEHQSNFSMTM